MQRIITEKIEMKRTIYFCDICKIELLPGRRPMECHVCGKEICEQCAHVISLHIRMKICATCLPYLDEYKADFCRIRDEFENRDSLLLKQWKEKSLNAEKERTDCPS